MLCFDTRFFSSTVYKICSYSGLYLYIISFCCCVIFPCIEELCFYLFMLVDIWILLVREKSKGRGALISIAPTLVLKK